MSSNSFREVTGPAGVGSLCMLGVFLLLDGGRLICFLPLRFTPKRLLGYSGSRAGACDGLRSGAISHGWSSVYYPTCGRAYPPRRQPTYRGQQPSRLINRLPSRPTLNFGMTERFLLEAVLLLPCCLLRR